MLISRKNAGVIFWIQISVWTSMPKIRFVTVFIQILRLLGEWGGGYFYPIPCFIKWTSITNPLNMLLIASVLQWNFVINWFWFVDLLVIILKKETFRNNMGSTRTKAALNNFFAILILYSFLNLQYTARGIISTNHFMSLIAINTDYVTTI